MSATNRGHRPSRPLWLLLLAACSSSTSGASSSTGPTGRDVSTMFVGGDISALTRIEQAGGVFHDSGPPEDAIALLRKYGSNTFRLRLFVNPNDSDVVVNDLPYTLALAARVKAAGAKLELDFHYSDTWADPGHQTPPAAWSGLSFDSLAAQVERYTAGVIAQLKHQGTLPDIVQIGNEIDAGMLWPTGQVGGSYDTPTQWDQFTKLLKAGIQGVRDSLGPSDTVRIMLHYSGGGSSGGTQWFFDHMSSYGVPFDYIGLSYYPWWHGSIADLRANLTATAQRYGKDIIVIETSYPWRAGGWESMVVDTFAMVWGATPSGQRQFLSDLLSVVRTTEGNHGAGVIWWYPEAIPVSGLFVWGGGSLALFDTTGKVLPAASVFNTK